MKLAALILWFTWMAAAQARGQSQGENLPPSVSNLLNELSEIDKLRTLNPLKLTNDQIDKLIASLQASQKSYNRKILDLATSTISQLSSDAKAHRPRMLAGGVLPKEFQDKVKRLQREFAERRDAEEAATLASVVSGLRKTLTEAQVREAVKQARTMAGSGASGSDDQYFNLYALTQFILYPRAVPLLEELKKARAQAGSDSG